MRVSPLWVTAVAVGCHGTDGPVQVDVVEDQAAQVVELPNGRAWVVRRRCLPPDAREGDVVVDGRVDRSATERLRARVVEARAKLKGLTTPGTW